MFGNDRVHDPGSQQISRPDTLRRSKVGRMRGVAEDDRAGALAGKFLGDLGVEAESGLERGLRPVADNLLGQLASAEHRHVGDASHPVPLG